jgi:hypothetical protein
VKWSSRSTVTREIPALGHDQVAYGLYGLSEAEARPVDRTTREAAGPRALKGSCGWISAAGWPDARPPPRDQAPDRRHEQDHITAKTNHTSLRK